MGCTSSSTQSSQRTLQPSPQPAEAVSRSRAISPEPEVTIGQPPAPTKENVSLGGQSQNGSRSQTRASSIAFEVMLGDGNTSRKPVPKRLSRLEPLDAPRLTAEELDEKLRLAERKRNSELDARAKTASESRRLSKRKRELQIAMELERQHQQVQELEKRLESANKQRELNNMVKAERQKLREERQKRARDKKQRMLKEDLDFDVEQDETFNNDDVDSWLEGSNNESNTVDTGFSSATSERIYSGRTSPKKRYNPVVQVQRSNLGSASTVISCDETTSCNNRPRSNHRSSTFHSDQSDPFFDQ